jgi:hypothetical protein
MLGNLKGSQPRNGLRLSGQPHPSAASTRRNAAARAARAALGSLTRLAYWLHSNSGYSKVEGRIWLSEGLHAHNLRRMAWRQRAYTKQADQNPQD